MQEHFELSARNVIATDAKPYQVIHGCILLDRLIILCKTYCVELPKSAGKMLPICLCSLCLRQRLVPTNCPYTSISFVLHNMHMILELLESDSKRIFCDTKISSIACWEHIEPESTIHCNGIV